MSVLSALTLRQTHHTTYPNPPPKQVLVVGSADDLAKPIFQGTPHTASQRLCSLPLLRARTTSPSVRLRSPPVTPPALPVASATDLSGIQGTAHCFLNESKLGAVKYPLVSASVGLCNVLYTEYPSWRGACRRTSWRLHHLQHSESSLTRPIRSMTWNIHDGKPVYLSSSSTSPD